MPNFPDCNLFPSRHSREQARATSQEIAELFSVRSFRVLTRVISAPKEGGLGMVEDLRQFDLGTWAAGE